MNIKLAGKLFVFFSLFVSSISMAAIQQTEFVIGAGGGSETGSGSFTWDDTGVVDGSILSITDILSLSFTISGGTVIGDSSSFLLSDCTFAEIGFTPTFGGGIFGLDCDNGVNEIDSTGNSFSLNGGAPVLFFEPGTTSPAPTPPGSGFEMLLEEPSADSVYSGIGNIQGWAISPDGIDRIELFIDGQYWTNPPYGGQRTDVRDAYPNVTNSENSGFTMAYGYSNLSAGQHTITARAISSTGEIREQSASFEVKKFHKLFIFSDETVDPSQADLVHDGRKILINNIVVAGESFNITMEWRTATQDFAIVDIQPAN